jgi:hypothetical protein
VNGTWFLPSFNESSCEAQKGCFDFFNEIGMIHIQFAFSPKNYGNCSGLGREWISYFSWEKAQWVPASFRFENIMY